MDYYHNIESALEYIETNLKNDITLLDIAQSAFLSPFHFHRIFSNVVGETVMNYLKRRRLTDSLQELLLTNKSILSISCEYCFESQEVYLRAFKKYFGVTPSAYRKNKIITRHFERQKFTELLLKKIKEGDYYMKRVIIIEVGSTNTKTYMAYEDMRVDTLPLKYIPFKDNYDANKGLNNQDIATLVEHIKELQSKYNLEIKAYGTSIFRKITEEQKKSFITHIKENTDVNFKVISQEDENIYTTRGVINDVSEEVTVLITGGGSTELSKCKNGEIINSCHIDFGVAEITKHFPDLSNDNTDIALEDVIEFVRDNADVPKIDTGTLVLAGGQHMMFADIAKYNIEKNSFYDDINQKYMISIKDSYECDKRFFNKDSLNKYKKLTPDNEGWWDGARAARGCVEAFVEGSKVRYIIPTDISMVYGLAREAFEGKK